MSLLNPSTHAVRGRPKRVRRSTAALLAALILTTGFTGAGLSISTPAHAISPGPGVWFVSAEDGAGAFQHSNGSLVYCAELGRAAAMSANPAMNATTSLPAFSVGSFMIGGNWFNDVSAPALSGAGFTHMNYVLSHWGQTNDNAQAAAVQIAIWQLRAAGSSAGYQSALQFFRNGVGSGVVARANQMIAEAQNSTAASSAPDDPRILVGSTPYSGTVVVDPGTTSLTITNGVFTQTGTNTITFSPATTSVRSIAFIGVPPADLNSWDRFYRVTVTGTYQYRVYGSMLYGRPGGSFDQGLVTAPVPQYRSGTYNAVYVDPDTIWSPTLTTAVPAKIVRKGASFSDVVTFGVAIGSNPWRTAQTAAGGTIYAPIVANGTLYGPFLADPALNPSAQPPVGAPVAATASIRTSTDQGPGSYEVDVAGTSRETGYYSWVWNIEFDEQLRSVQSPITAEPSLPANYFFTDGFGQVTEGQVTPMELNISTSLKDNQVTLADLQLEDVVTPTLVDGGWLQGNGGRMPVTVRLTAYGQNGDVERQASPPAEAEQIATTTVTVDTPRAGHDAPAMQISLADFKRFDGGAVQACVRDADQPAEYRGFVVETCDDYGAPGEVFSFVKPAVTTKAQSTGSLGELIHDSAIVSEADLPAGSTIGATAYLRPVAGQFKYDTNWQPILDAAGDPTVWTQDEIDAISPDTLCEVQPVGRTTRVPATTRGEYQLPGIRAGSEGSGIDWVEDTEIPDPVTGDPVEWSRGKCGVAEEYTDLPTPKVSTQVHLAEAKPTDTNHDNIIVKDLMDVTTDSLYEYEAVVEAFYTADEKAQPLCDVSEKVWTSAAVKITGAGTFQTNSYRVSDVVRAGSEQGRLDHVEQLIRIDKATGDREVVAVGECGAETESTIIRNPPPLSITGGQSMVVAGVLGVALLLGGAVLFTARRQRQSLAAQVRECSDLE